MSFQESTAVPSPTMFERQRFDPATAAGPRILQLLLATDGSTTRLCETVAGGPVQLVLLHQAITEGELPPDVRQQLPGQRFIERLTCLVAHGQVMMDNLSYIALDGLAPDIRADLEGGRLPIGHLLARMWVRRVGLPPSAALQQRLWAEVGQPDPASTRNYVITTPEGPRMLICECWRNGMQLTPAG